MQFNFPPLSSRLRPEDFINLVQVVNQHSVTYKLASNASKTKIMELEKWQENTNIVKDNIHVDVYFVSLIIVVKCIATGKHYIKTGLNI